MSNRNYEKEIYKTNNPDWSEGISFLNRHKTTEEFNNDENILSYKNYENENYKINNPHWREAINFLNRHKTFEEFNNDENRYFVSYTPKGKREPKKFKFHNIKVVNDKYTFIQYEQNWSKYSNYSVPSFNDGHFIDKHFKKVEVDLYDIDSIGLLAQLKTK